MNGCTDPTPWHEGCDREHCTEPVGGEHAETCATHEPATLTGGNIPRHVPGAYPRLSCCGGPVQLVAMRPTGLLLIDRWLGEHCHMIGANREFTCWETWYYGDLELNPHARESESETAGAWGYG